MGKWDVKKLATAVALCGALICSPVQAKTFVGVLWPMFGPLPAIGLVELVAELKMMPDVEVETYVHQAWPSLVKDIDHLPPGTHTVVVGYSLGANSSVFVANNAKHVDLIIALQPSMLSWNPDVTGKVGRMIEIYNPNPWETFGGMGSRKLIGPNIEYIANNDSHPGAQFDPQFRNLVKSEVARFATEDRLETARADIAKPIEVAEAQRNRAIRQKNDAASEHRTKIAQAELPKPLRVADAQPRQPIRQQREPAVRDRMKLEQAEVVNPPQPTKLERVADEQPIHQPSDTTAFLNRLSSAVNSGDLFAERRLTVAELKDYAARTYRGSRTAALMMTASD